MMLNNEDEKQQPENEYINVFKKFQEK